MASNALPIVLSGNEVSATSIIYFCHYCRRFFFVKCAPISPISKSWGQFVWTLSHNLTIIRVCGHQCCHWELRAGEFGRKTRKLEENYAPILVGCIEVRTQASMVAQDLDVCCGPYFSITVTISRLVPFFIVLSFPERFLVHAFGQCLSKSGCSNTNSMTAELIIWLSPGPWNLPKIWRQATRGFLACRIRL